MSERQARYDVAERHRDWRAGREPSQDCRARSQAVRTDGRRDGVSGQTAEGRKLPIPDSSTGPPPAPRAVQGPWLSARVDRAITLRLTDGKTISGTLVSFDTYCLLLRDGQGRALLVYKQAIAYLAERQSAGAADG